MFALDSVSAKIAAAPFPQWKPGNHSHFLTHGMLCCCLQQIILLIAREQELSLDAIATSDAIMFVSE